MGTIQSRPSTTAPARGHALLYGGAALPAAKILLPATDTPNARQSLACRGTKQPSVTLSTNVSCEYDDGNVTMRAIESPPITARYPYDDGGNTSSLARPLPDGNPPPISSKHTHDISDFYYYGHRYYNPSTGRWPSRDPIGNKGGLNLYGFLGNDSIDYLDELGLMTKAAVDAAFAQYTAQNAGKPCSCVAKSLFEKSYFLSRDV